MGRGGDPRRGGGGRLWCGDLRGRPERLRLLRAVTGHPDRKRDGGVASASWSGAGHKDHRQRHVSHVVIVQKYGGTSVGSAARIPSVSRHISETVRQGHQVVAGLSANGHTNDALICLADTRNP